MTNQEYKQAERNRRMEAKRRDKEEQRPAKELSKSIVKILRKNNILQAKWHGSSMVRGWGEYASSGYTISPTYSFVDIRPNGFKDSSKEREFIDKLRSVLNDNKIIFGEDKHGFTIQVKKD